MSTFLPKPQEFSYLPESLPPAADLALYLSPWSGDDATLESLLPALKAFLGRDAAVHEVPLPGAAGCTLALASSPQAAAALAQQALDQMASPVRTLRLCLDGGNMSEPTDGMGKVQAPAAGIAALPEAYTLVLNAAGAAVAGVDRAGLFYGVQTLIQALRNAAGPCPGLLIRDFPSQAWRGIHFDMKYDFYRVETIKEQLRALAALKMNCVLFEYEDKFPYQRHPDIVDRKLALTPAEVEELRRLAARLHIRIVPLIQTLGHLEFALKRKSKAHLREVPDGYSQMCPAKPEAQQFVRDLVDEVLAAHPDAKFLHLGADETALLGRCPECKAFADQHGPVRIWVDHYARLCQYVLDKGVRPILWEDIPRRDAALAQRLPKGIVLTYWIYETVRDRHGERAVPKELQDFYHCADKRAAELPATLGTYPHYDYYRRLGFDIIAVPCYNVGTLVPVFELATRNTSTWAEKNNLCGGLGMINSSWACFMMHPDACWYGVAQTADNTWWWPSVDRLDLDTRFGQALFGLPTPEIAECLAAISVGVGFPSRLKRPLSLLSFAYMENVIYFEGNMEMRQKMGGASAMNKLDMHNHLLRKLELIEEDKLQGEIRRQLDYAESITASALRRLKAVKGKVTRHADWIDLYLTLGELKRMRCGHWRFFLDVFARRAAPPDEPTRARAAELLARENALRRKFQRFFNAKVCAPDARRVTGLHFDGERKFLADLAAGKPVPPSYRTNFAAMADKAQDIKDF
jgi:hypothetical protein